jgi:pSer/pThr/pTyr-binding forkhead associated (FHA) protein
MPQLIIKWGNRETRFAVTTPSIDIGRSDGNLLQLKDVKISRYHCKIVQTPLGFLLSDSESSNGTFLNGKRVERILLHNSDVLKVGNVEMVFLENDSVQAENKEPVVISLSNPSDDASVGEVTTVINIQDESAGPVVNGASQNRNGTAQGVVANHVSAGTVVAAQVAKLVIPNQTPPVQRVMNPVRDNSPIGNRSNGNKVNGNTNTNTSKMESNISNGVNNQVFQNGSGKSSGTPPPQPQTARIVTAKPISVSGSMPKPAPLSVPAIQKPVLRVTPPAPKPQSGLISRLAPRSLSGNGLSKTPKAKASFAGRISGVGVKGARTNRQEMADEGPAQPNKNKNKNMLYIIGGAVLILIVIIAFLASSGSNKKAVEDNKREVEVLNAANKLYTDKEYSVALKKYEAFLEEFKDSKHSADVKEQIKKIKERDEKEKEAKPKLMELKRKKKDYPTSKYSELLKEFDAFIKEYSEISPAILQEAKGERDTVKRIASSSGEDDVNISFTKTMGDANKLRDNKNYDGALAKLKSFLKENSSLNDRQKNTIGNEIKAIEKEKEEKSEKK